MTISPEDYRESRCPLCSAEEEERAANSVPVVRILDRLDGYLKRNDAAGAEAHLKYWLGEAEALGDRRGALSVVNELMGLCRKLGKKEEALEYAKKGCGLVERLGMTDTVTAGTTYLNAATVNKAFGNDEKSAELFAKARPLYERALPQGDERLAGLYNNMAVTLVALKRFDEARGLYSRAIEIMEAKGGFAEVAVSCLNLVSLAEAEADWKGEVDENAVRTEIAALLARAQTMLNKATVRDGNYAFTCEKCAETFAYYGMTAFAEELRLRARGIYEGS